MSEAFIYIWYDAPNDMYYLGWHKGSPDDTYTHSSSIWEHFTKDNIPEGVTRRILAYGTDEEMCILEHELLVNRKNRCWDRYYNESLGDPRYVDQSGENNPNWKGGIKVNDPKAYNKVSRQKPEYKAWLKVYNKEYNQIPKHKEHREAYMKEYNQTPKRKAYNQTPERKAQMVETSRRWRARKKVELQGEGSLEAYLR